MTLQEILKCDRFNERIAAVICFGAVDVYYTVSAGSILLTTVDDCFKRLIIEMKPTEQYCPVVLFIML